MKNALYVTLAVLISYLGGYFMGEADSSDSPSSTIDVVASAELVTATNNLESEKRDENHSLKEALIEREEVSTEDALLSCKTHDDVIKGEKVEEFPGSNVINEIRVSPTTNLLAVVDVTNRVQNDSRKEFIEPLPRDNIVSLIHIKSSELKDLMKLIPKKASVISNKTDIKYKLVVNYAHSKSFEVTNKTYISQLLPVESNTCFNTAIKASLDLGIEAKARSPGFI